MLVGDRRDVILKRKVGIVVSQMGLSAVKQMESEEEGEPLPGKGGRLCLPALGGWPLGNSVKERGKEARGCQREQQGRGPAWSGIAGQCGWSGAREGDAQGRSRRALWAIGMTSTSTA